MIAIKHSAILLFGVIALGAICVEGFSSGAPIDVCANSKSNRPRHGNAEPQPLSTSPYTVQASSGSYDSGSQITVTIQGSPFKGFFLQARNPQNDSWIGTWSQSPNTKTYDECGAITHADPRDKEEATFIWNAPADAAGQVYFVATIVKNYSTFWVDLVAQTPQQ